MTSQNRSLNELITGVSLFAIAMAYLESAVVVYLRKVHYPEGFDFPLQPIDVHTGITEVFREFATIVMLISVAYIAGRNLNQRFAWFLWTFALWDIFYYVFLKVLIDWPAHLLEWDVLFLIPLTWLGPVIAPVVLSLMMMLLAYYLLYFDQIGRGKLTRREWSLLVTGSIVTIISFTYAHLEYLVQYGSEKAIKQMNLIYLTLVPEHFTWPIFLLGCGIIMAGIIHFIVRQKNIRILNKKGQWI